MKNSILLCGLILLTIGLNAQNVGIGTATPTSGRLHVVTTDNATAGMFSNGTTGIGLIHELGRPAIGMNMYYSGGYKFKGAGWGGLWYYLPTSGSLSYYSSNASGAADGSVGFSSSLMSITNDGNVGISATPTEAKLQVHEPAGNTQFIAAAGSNLPGISTFVPISSPSIGFNTRYQSGYKFMGSGYGSFFQYSPSSGTLNYYYSSTTGAADGSLSSVFAMAIDSNGRLGIGTSVPKAPLHVTGNVVFGTGSLVPATGYKISIDGKVICEELKVQLSGSWPDYVFDNKYALLPLDELEEKVMEQKHLPGIPAASQVEAANGFEVGDMQKRVVEKVEELYRYMFELNRENKALKAELKEIKAQLGN